MVAPGDQQKHTSPHRFLVASSPPSHWDTIVVYCCCLICIVLRLASIDLLPYGFKIPVGPRSKAVDAQRVSANYVTAQFTRCSTIRAFLDRRSRSPPFSRHSYLLSLLFVTLTKDKLQFLAAFTLFPTSQAKNTMPQMDAPHIYKALDELWWCVAMVFFVKLLKKAWCEESNDPSGSQGRLIRHEFAFLSLGFDAIVKDTSR
jgi:hypothetical protein